MIYLISDTHFNHKNIIDYENRPFAGVDVMNDALIKNWNSIVQPRDTVIHLGDVGLGNVSDLKWIIPSLNGTKILIKGNHDSKSRQFFLDCGFQMVCNTYMIEHNGKTIFFSHRPDSRPGSGEKYDLHFYGHVHSKGYHDNYPTIARNGACLCVERWDYKPVELDKVFDLCESSGITAPNL